MSETLRGILRREAGGERVADAAVAAAEAAGARRRRAGGGGRRCAAARRAIASQTRASTWAAESLAKRWRAWRRWKRPARRTRAGEDVDALFDAVLGGGDELGGGGGRGGAEVGDEVGDGEVGLVADGGDDGELGGGDGAGEGLVVEAGEVFEGASAAGDEDEVDLFRVLR